MKIIDEIIQTTGLTKEGELVGDDVVSGIGFVLLLKHGSISRNLVPYFKLSENSEKAPWTTYEAEQD